MDRTTAEAFYDHVPVEVRGRLFADLPWSSYQGPRAKRELPELSAPVSRSHWTALATEAAGTRSPRRLSRLARSPQVRVRRIVAENPNLDQETFSYLLAWAIKRDDRSIRTLVRHQNPLWVLEAAASSLSLGSSQMPWSEWASNLATLDDEQAAPTIVEIVAGRHPLGSAHHRRALVTAIGAKAETVIDLPELFALAFPDGRVDEWAKTALWEIQRPTLERARLMLANIPTSSTWRSHGALSVEAAETVLIEDGSVPHRARMALSCDKRLSGSAYDRLFELVEQEFDGGNPQLRHALVQSRHLGALNDQQIEQLVTSMHLSSSAEDVLKKVGDRLSEQSVIRLLGQLEVRRAMSWLSGTLLPNIPRNLVTVRAVIEGPLGRESGNWVEAAMRAAGDDEELTAVLVELLDGRMLAMRHLKHVAAAIAARLTAAFGQDPDAWTTALELMDDWEGTLTDLVETVALLRPVSEAAA
jgi:hypothetical protein